MISHYDKVWYCDQWVITRAQSANWDQEISDEDIEEIGNPGIVETIIDPVIPTTITINTNDWGATDFLAQLMGEKASVRSTSPYSDDDNYRNDWVVNSEDMSVQGCDFIVRVRDEKTDTLDRTVWIPGARISSIAWSYSVDGNASENVTLRGDTDLHLIGEYKDAGILIGTFATTDTFTVTLASTAMGGLTELYMTVNDVLYDDTHISWSGTTVTVSTMPANLVAGDRIRLLWFKDTPATLFDDLDTSAMGAIKGANVIIGLGDAGKIINSTKTLRLQSVTVTATVTREDIKELGTRTIVSSSMKKQEVAIEATVLEDSMENFAYMLGVSAAEWTNRATVGIAMKLQDSIGNAQCLYVNVYDDADHTNLLKRLYVSNMRLIKSPFSLDVGGTGQMTLSFKADNWLWTGQGEVGGLIGAYPSVWRSNPGETTTSTSTSTTTTA